MITQSVLDFINYFEGLPINIKNNIITVALIINLIGLIAFGIYLVRKEQ
ncbi:MAG TPA: hypothetical protein IAD45_06300 [Candidatus Faecimonas intestinavium]|nr:hypothetical protein [Candidatus Faecimonas intestinavium]